LEDVVNVSLHDMDQVCVAHNQAGVTESAKGRLEGGRVLGFWMNNVLVIGNKQVKAGIAGMGSKGFYQVLHNRWDRDVSDGDGVE
jgi:hypothetical protein